MLFKLKHTLSIILIFGFLVGCQTRRATSSFRKQKQKTNLEQVKAQRQKEKRKKEYNESVARKRKKHYNRQAESTRQRWDINKERAEQWNKKEFHNKSLRYRIQSFFDRFKREPKPNDGLFSKRQMRRRKGNIFQRLFKRKRNKRKK